MPSLLDACACALRFLVGGARVARSLTFQTLKQKSKTAMRKTGSALLVSVM